MPRSARCLLVAVAALASACSGGSTASDLGADAAVPDLARAPDLWMGTPPDLHGATGAVECQAGATCKGGEVVGVGLGASGDLYQYAHAALVAEEKVFRGSLIR